VPERFLVFPEQPGTRRFEPIIRVLQPGTVFSFERMRQMENHGKCEQGSFKETFLNSGHQSTVILSIVGRRNRDLNKSFCLLLLSP
jgi:hypothetical protein